MTTKRKPIPTIIRECLPEGVWRPGVSKTYSDTSYTRKEKKTRWASKYIRPTGRSPGRNTQLEQKINRAIKKEGYTGAYQVLAYSDEICVYHNSPIEIKELGE